MDELHTVGRLLSTHPERMHANSIRTGVLKQRLRLLVGVAIGMGANAMGNLAVGVVDPSTGASIVKVVACSTCATTIRRAALATATMVRLVLVARNIVITLVCRMKTVSARKCNQAIGAMGPTSTTSTIARRAVNSKVATRIVAAIQMRKELGLTLNSLRNGSRA